MIHFLRCVLQEIFMTKKKPHKANTCSLADIFSCEATMYTEHSAFSPLWKEEFYDVVKVLEMGAKKYEADGWLDSDGHGTSHREMHASLFRHLAASCAGIAADNESGLDHLLHVACRALMLYCRKQRNIRNSKDD